MKTGQKFKVSVSQSKTARTHAFSLIELLTVVAIISILTVLAAASISGIQRSTALGTDGSALLDYLTMARQSAMTHNKPVRVWICQDVGNTEPTDTLLLYWEEVATNGNITHVPVDRELKLHMTVALSGNATWSSAVTISKSQDPKYKKDSPTFRFLPDGSTDLSEGTPPTLTLVHRTHKDSTTLPDNFFTLQIDQQTGSIQTFRPQ